MCIADSTSVTYPFVPATCKYNMYKLHCKQRKWNKHYFSNNSFINAYAYVCGPDTTRREYVRNTGVLLSINWTLITKQWDISILSTHLRYCLKYIYLPMRKVHILLIKILLIDDLCMTTKEPTSGYILHFYGYNIVLNGSPCSYKTVNCMLR